MSLGESVAAELPRFRAEAESLMVDACRITQAGEPVWDDTNGVFTPGDPVTVYEGKCRLRRPSAAPKDVDSGEAAWSVDDYVLSIPVAGTDVVFDGHAVEILTSANDPATVGLELTVMGGHWQTYATARRLPCRVVSRDA